MQSVIARVTAAAVLCGAGAAVAQVTPPPLPPGSHLVRPEAGMDESERKRHVRAHHHKFHHKKDFTRDDSVHGHESEVAARTGVVPTIGGATPLNALGARGTAGTSGTAQDGRGTGPARQQTDRGASSWFFGQPVNKK